MALDLQGLQEVLVGLLYLAIPKDWQGSKQKFNGTDILKIVAILIILCRYLMLNSPWHQVFQVHQTNLSNLVVPAKQYGKIKLKCHLPSPSLCFHPALSPSLPPSPSLFFGTVHLSSRSSWFSWESRLSSSSLRTS